MHEEEFLAWKSRLKSQGRLRITISGVSMSPVLHNGAEVTVEPVELSQIAKFDVLVFYHGHSLVCHYVQCLRGQQVICNSYQFEDSDAVDFSAILGRVTSHRLSLWQKLRCTFS